MSPTINATAGEEFARARAALAAGGCDFALLSSLANVTYVSGYEVPVPVGALAELAYGPPLALCSVHQDAAWLVVPDAAVAAVRERAPAMEVLPFPTFDSFNQTDPRGAYVTAIRDALRQAGLAGATATLGVEGRAMPHAVSEMLATEFPALRLVEVEDAMHQARRIKTGREIDLLRRAARLGDVAHETLADLIREAGRTEYAMWAEIAARVYGAAGREIPLTGELVTGPRTSVVAYPNGPRERTTAPGDAALMDLSGRIDGYWFDCTNTHVVAAEPTPTQVRYGKASRAACEAAMDALRPGHLAADAFAAAEAAFAKHGLPTAHYAGHQIGVAVNELPRLVPYDRTPIAAGMVFSVEPGAYEGAGGSVGARSEKMVLVTPSGPEVLSTFGWGI